jgi:hypothetical protein
MLRFVLSAILAGCITAFSYAGDTVCTKITATRVGPNVEIVAEEINTIDVWGDFRWLDACFR